MVPVLLELLYQTRKPLCGLALGIACTVAAYFAVESYPGYTIAGVGIVGGVLGFVAIERYMP